MTHPLGTVVPVRLQLHVAERLEPLADQLAELLAVAPDDPFAPEVVAVPSAGVRSWLTERLARHHGIAARVDMVFPGEVVRRVLGDDPRLRSWDVGPLTWAVHQLHRHPAGLLRSRAVADLFDRYALHRVEMVLRWEVGDDVDGTGAPLPDPHRWQPSLWRDLVGLLGPSGARVRAELLGRLAAGELHPDLPSRVAVFGLGGLPTPHLEVLGALAASREVHLFVPTPSSTTWQRITERARGHEGLAEPRSQGALEGMAAHPLVATWGVAAREAHYLVAGAAWRHAADIRPPAAPDDTPPANLLAAVQRAIRLDEPPAPLPMIDGTDHSIVWHRCHGAARQVEVLRDQLLHVLEERLPDGRPRYEPRDIAVLCPDLPTFAPLVEATFLGDPEHGVPSLPVRIADRSLRQDLPLLDAVGALLELQEGRFRATEVLAFASRLPVRQRFGLREDDLELAAAWVEDTNIRWGLDARSHQRFGLPAALAAHSWRAGLDQLLVGAAMADDELRLGPGGVAPLAGIEADQVEALGRLAELVHVLGEAHERLERPATPRGWCAELAAAAESLLALDESDAWQWVVLRDALDDVAEEASVAGTAVDEALPTSELAALFATRLSARPGRARFGTGAITVSSLVGLRGVPHPVLCLLGLDGDLGAARPPAADDLMAAAPLVGDRTPQHELRASLLDALLAAGDRLIVCSTGRDLLSNAEVPPAVPLAELLDLLELTAGRPFDGVAHPRQAWSERNFVAGALGIDGAWSFDAAAHRAALARRAGGSSPPRRLLELDAEPDGWPGEVRLEALEQALVHPVRAFLQGRLGLSVPGNTDQLATDVIPLALDGLQEWQLADRLLRFRLDHGAAWDADAERRWWDRCRRAGAVPPLGRAEAVIAEATTRVELLIAAARDAGVPLEVAPTTRRVDLPALGPAATRVHGEVSSLHDDVLAVVTPSRWKPKELLTVWLRLAALALADPERSFTGVLVSRADRQGGFTTRVEQLRVRDADAARRVLELALALHQRARCAPVPALAATAYHLGRGDLDAARDAWSSSRGDGSVVGEGHDAWVSLLYDGADLDDVLPLGLPEWSHELWTAFDETVERS